MSTIHSRLVLSTLLALTLLILLVPGTVAAEEAPVGRTSSVDTESTEQMLLASLASCTADCENGTTVTCSGSPCSAQDQNCSQNEQGFCTSDTGQKFCEPLCPDCDFDFVCNFSACTDDPDCDNRCRPLWFCETNADCSQFNEGGFISFCNTNDNLCVC